MIARLILHIVYIFRIFKMINYEYLSIMFTVGHFSYLGVS
jgi:hypothetical protein